MNSIAAPPTYSIGWDVGGWNCDKNGTSRDAVVILSGEPAIIGKPWRGNLRTSIAKATTTVDWLQKLFELCQVGLPDAHGQVTLAIDTPLGFPIDFVSLITGRGWAEPNQTSGLNHYLFRHTERYLFDRKVKPLSAIKDMIGSQATKGMHVLAKFAPQCESCGVWTDGHSFRAIETYPTIWRETLAIQNFLKGRHTLGHADLDDALVCAMVAHFFSQNRPALESPPASIPHSEGWIWAPSR